MSLARAYDEQTSSAILHTSQITTIVVSENSLFCMGLKQVLSNTRFLASDTAFSEHSPLPCPADTGLVIVIIDANHYSDPAKVVRWSRVRCPGTRVLVMADRLDPNLVPLGPGVGVDGFCNTTVEPDVLIKSLELVAAGGSIFPYIMIRSLIDQVSSRLEQPPKEASASEAMNVLDLKAHRLSTREGEILRCIMGGAPNKVIAREYGLTEATVKVHVKSILRKIGVRNRTQAAMWAASLSSELRNRPNC